MNIAEFHAKRRFVDTPSGRIAFVEHGAGLPALFIHGVPLNGFHWRHVMDGVADSRRCIALDLMGLGYSEIAPSQDVSFAAQARMIGEFIVALDLDRVDLVGNDSGGAIAQIFAARNPGRLRSLTLTNCDVHDGWPPEAILPNLEAARKGTLAGAFDQLVKDPAAARTRFARAYADPTVFTDELIRLYFEPFLQNAHRRDAFHRYFVGFDCAQTVAIEPLLKELHVPTLIVWALNDIFFPVKWAYWLRSTIPGAVDVVEVPDAKQFFAEDRPAALIEPLRNFFSPDRRGQRGG